MWRDVQHVWNPSQEDIKKWAYSNLGVPDQDWELAVASIENIVMICGLVDDENCRKNSFFLSSLYVFVGDVVKSGEEKDIKQLSLLLKKATMITKSEKLRAWVERSNQLIQNPDSYNYVYWGLGSKYVY